MAFLFLGILIGLAIPPVYKWVIASFFTPKQSIESRMAFGTSMAEAEARTDKHIIIGASILHIIILFLCFYSTTDLAKFVDRASGLANGIGGALIIISFLVLLIGNRMQAKEKAAVLWLFLLGLGIATAAGFNFDYFGLN